ETLVDCAYLLYARGSYEDAEPLYRRALEIQRAVFGDNNPEIDITGSLLGQLYYAQGAVGQAVTLFDKAFDDVSKEFYSLLPYMNEKDRLLFQDRIGWMVDVYFSLCFKNRDENPALIGKMYDLVLQRKGFVARSMASLHHKIANSDSESKSLWEALIAKRSQLAALIMSTPTDPTEWKRKVDLLQGEANELERKVASRGSLVSELNTHSTWREVQSGLKA